MTLLSVFRIDVLESFKTLKMALQELELAMEADRDLPAWFLPPQELPMQSAWDVRTQAHRLIRQLEYLDCQKPREILVGAGLIAASENTLQQIEHLNQCKDNFKQAILALKKANIKMNDSFLCEAFEPLLEKNSRSETIATTLKKVGLARLHLKQCYRRIPVFLERPVKVSWTWANTKAITRITTEQARKLLLKQGNDNGIELQLAKLQALSQQEPLAIVQELAPHLRANVVFHNPEISGENLSKKNLDRRVMVKGPVPIFYLAKAEDPVSLPIIRPPGLKRGKNTERRVRSDVKLESEMYLPSIRVHRYIP